MNWRPRLLTLLIVVGTAGCATAPPPTPPVITWEDKAGWILRLENQRILRDPAPSAPVVLAPAQRGRPAIVAPAQPSDIIRLLKDPEARVRRRAALAAGRIGLAEAIEPLTALLADEEAEVRQMAAFALGLIGDSAARSALGLALNDPSPLVQGRAAEALGLIGQRDDAAAVSAMVRKHVAARVLATLEPDDLTHPLPPAVEAARLGLYALVRLGSYEALAAAALDASGQPVSRWWPVAYALQRIADPRAVPALNALLASDGRYTPAFAARGLGVTKAQAATEPLVRVARERRAHPAVVVEAVRALTAIGDRRAAATMLEIAADPKADRLLRLEALTAVGVLRVGDAVDLLLDLLSDPWPPLRSAAMLTLALVDAETFLTALSGLDPDRDWTVRAAQAAALGTLAPEQGRPRLTAMLKDPDQRVVAAVLRAMASARIPGSDAVLTEHLAAEDFVVRARAAEGLGQLGAAGAAGALADAYRASRGDNTYVARAAALDALVKVNAEAARAVLQEALADPDWAVRIRAADLLRQLGSTGGDLPERIRPVPTPWTPAEPLWRQVVAPQYSPRAYVETDRGTIELELAIADAPLTVANFIALARRGFFNGLPMHRVVADFVVQDGDPRGDGEGGPGHTIRDELNQRPYLRGTLGMALDWRDTGGSQFFITHSPQPHLDARYTAFGHVVNGMEVVDRIEPLDVIRSVRIWDGTTPE